MLDENFIWLIIVSLFMISSPIWLGWANVLTDRLTDYIKENVEIED